MKERGIIMSAPMALALLDGRISSLFHYGNTIVEISDLIDIGRGSVGKTLRRLGLRRRAARRPGVGVGATNSAWGGGRRIRPDGYVLMWTETGDMLEHRLVMSRHLGRDLRSEEVVHHQDGNKQNNALSNLRLCSQSEHIKEHLPSMHAARYGT